jgi:hypothetical protein
MVEPLHIAIVRAFSVVKKSAATSNYRLGYLSQDVASHIIAACHEMLTQSHQVALQCFSEDESDCAQLDMSINRWLAESATSFANRQVKLISPIEAGKHIGLGQSASSVCSAVLRIVVVLEFKNAILPALQELQAKLQTIQHSLLIDFPVPNHAANAEIESIEALEHAANMLKSAISEMCKITMTDPATGDAHDDVSVFNQLCIDKIASITNVPFRPMPVTSHGLVQLDDIYKLGAAIRRYTDHAMTISHRVQAGDHRRSGNNMEAAGAVSKARLWRASVMLSCSLAGIDSIAKNGFFPTHFGELIATERLVQSVPALVEVCNFLRAAAFQASTPELTRNQGKKPAVRSSALLVVDKSKSILLRTEAFDHQAQ